MCLSGARFERLEATKIRPTVELPEPFVEWVLESREKQRRALLESAQGTVSGQ